MNRYYIDKIIHPYTDHVNNLHGKSGAPCGTCRRYRMGAACMLRTGRGKIRMSTKYNDTANYRLKKTSMNSSHQL